MTAPYIPFDPTDPYGLRKRFNPALLKALQQPTDATSVGAPPLPQSTIGPTAAHNRGPQDAPLESDFLRMLKEVGVKFDDRLTKDLKGTPLSFLYGMGKSIVGDAAEVGKIALEPSGLVDQPKPGDAPRGERLLEKGLPLVLGFYPIGGATKAEVRLAEEALERGTILRTNEAERVIGRNAAGHEITNHGRTVEGYNSDLGENPFIGKRDPNYEPMKALGKDEAGNEITNRGTIRASAPPIRPQEVPKRVARPVISAVPGATRPGPNPNGTVQVMKRIKALGLEEPVRAEAAMRGEASEVNAEYAARTVMDSYDDLVKHGGLTPEAARATILMQHAADQSVRSVNPMSLEGTLAGESGMHRAPGVLPSPGNRIVASNLIKEDAISQAKKLKGDGVNVEMQRQPDGTWSILKKGEPQPSTAVAKVPKKELAKIGPQGGPIGEGVFQSRLMTTLEYRHEDVKALTPAEWYKRLSQDQNVPKAELDAVYASHMSPEDATHLADLDKRYNELVEWRSAPENQPENRSASYGSPEQEALWDAWHEKKREIDAISDERTQMRKEKKGWEKYLDKNGKISREKMQELVADESPVSALDVNTNSTEEGARQEMTHEDIRQEMEHLLEAKEEEIKTELVDKVANSHQERQEALDDAESALSSILGEDGAKSWMKKFISDHSLNDAHMQTDNHTLQNLTEGWDEDLWNTIEEFNPGTRTPVTIDDPLQVPIFGTARPVPTKDELRYHELLQERDQVYYRHEKAGQGDNPPLYGQEYNDVMSRIRTVDEELLALEDKLVMQKPEGQRKFMPRQWEEFRKKMQRAESADREGAQAALDHDNFDMDEHLTSRERDHIEQEAINNLEETGEYGGSGDRETQFHDYQRVDEDVPYREITIHQRGAGVRGGHFNDSNDLVAHARGEIHGDTYLMIEAQSDFAQRLKGDAPKRVPFADTERWAQLSTGASIIQAAMEKKRYFAWVTPANRMDRASLAEEAANITYGHAVPKAVKRIFNWLDMPFEPKKFLGEEAMRIEITPEMRKRILNAGIPALGLVGAAAIQTKKRD